MPNRKFSLTVCSVYNDPFSRLKHFMLIFYRAPFVDFHSCLYLARVLRTLELRGMKEMRIRS